MGLSTIFINVTAKNVAKDNEFSPYPVNINNILGYPPCDEFDDGTKTRIDLNAHFTKIGSHYSGGAYSDSRVMTALFVKETSEEIADLIETAQAEHINKLKRRGLALIL